MSLFLLHQPLGIEWSWSHCELSHRGLREWIWAPSGSPCSVQAAAQMPVQVIDVFSLSVLRSQQYVTVKRTEVSGNCRISLSCGFWLSIYSSTVLSVFGVRWYLQRSCTVITLTQGQAISHYLSPPALTLLHQCSCPRWAIHWALVQSAGLNHGICLARRAPHFK